jgi:hypothetical protein
VALERSRRETYSALQGKVLPQRPRPQAEAQAVNKSGPTVLLVQDGRP